VKSRAIALLAFVMTALLLVACFQLPFSFRVPSPIPSGGAYTGSDSATLTINSIDVGCCYVEGSLHFGRIDGPTVHEWKMDEPVPRGSGQTFAPNGPFAIGTQTFGIQPGDYTATFAQRPCDGNCGNLDAVVSQCSVTFSAEARASIRIEVTFPLEKQCTTQVS